MLNAKHSDLYHRGTRVTPRRARREEFYYNRTRSRHLRQGNVLVRLTTMAALAGLISLILWSIG